MSSQNAASASLSRSRSQSTKTRPLSVNQLEHRIIGLARLHLLWYVIASFPSMLLIFDQNACVSFQGIDPRLDFLFVQFFGYCLLPPFINSNVLRKPGYLVYHFLMAVLLAVVLFFTTFVHLVGLITDGAVAFRRYTSCANTDFGGVYYTLVANLGGLVMAVYVMYYTVAYLNKSGKGQLFIDFYFGEWKREGVPVMLVPQLLIGLVFAGLLYGVGTVVFPGFIAMYSPLQFVFMAVFALYLSAITLVYAPYMSQMFPLWYKIVGSGIYIGWNILIMGATFAKSTGSPDLMNGLHSGFSNGDYFTVWTVGYTLTAFLWVWLLPWFWSVFGVIWMWQFVEYILLWQYSKSDTAAGRQIVNGVLPSVVITIVLLAMMRIQGLNIRHQFPWFSAKSTVAKNQKAKWCCEACLVGCFTKHCMCCQCCEACVKEPRQRGASSAPLVLAV